MKLKVKKLHPNAVIPKYSTTGAAGFDLVAIRDTYLYPGMTTLIDTGLSFEVPVGYELQIRPRSGMSAKTKIRVANSPGTIDSDFRGEVKVILDNTGNGGYQIKIGDRIAQAVLVPVVQAEFEEVEELEQTERGEGGFGSTGK